MIKPKKKLVPLTNNDIILAILRNENNADRTDDYRQWLAATSHSNPANLLHRDKKVDEKQKPRIDVDSLNISEQLLTDHAEIDLASRLIKELTSQQCTSVNKQEKNAIHVRIKQYEELLSKVLAMHALSQEYYQTEVKEGEAQIGQMLSKVSEVTKAVEQARQHNLILKAYLKERSMKILHKLQIAIRMKVVSSINQQVLNIVAVWRNNFLTNMCYFNEDRILEFGVEKVLGIIEQTKGKFKVSQSDYTNYGCFEKIGQYLDNKLNKIISLLTEEMNGAILNFNPLLYGKILLNYNYLVKKLDLYSVIQNLPLLLETNLNIILKESFNQQMNSLEKLQSLSGTEYLQFFQRLLLKIENYFHNWHLATRWHLQNQETDAFGVLSKELSNEFLKFRKTIWIKSQQKVADLISKSYKFYTISLNQRTMLMLKLYDFIRAGNFFSSRKGKMIPKILKQKLRDQNQLFLKQVTNLLKFALNKQLRCSIFQELLGSLAVPESYVCELSEEQMLRIDQIINSEVPQDYQASGYKMNDDDNQLDLKYDKAFAFQKNSSCFYIQKGIIEFARRAYIQPKMNYEIFLKCKEMLELIIYWMFRLMCSDIFRKQLFEDWSGFSDLRFSQFKDIELNAGVLQYFIQCANRQGKCPKLRKEMQRIVSRLEATSHKNIRRQELPLSNIVFVNENVCALINWLRNNATKLFIKATPQEIERIKSDLTELFDITIELVAFTYSSYFEDLKFKYQPIVPIVIDLKWDMKKYNSENASNYREYKNKLNELISSQITGLRDLKYPQPINTRIQACMVDIFFQSLLDIYSKVQKINENGKQLMRLDAIQLSKNIESLGVQTAHSYKTYLDSYLSLWFLKDPKDLDKGIQLNQEHYPFRVWKNLIYTGVCSGQLSSKEKRDFLLKVAQNNIDVIAKKRCK